MTLYEHKVIIALLFLFLGLSLFLIPVVAGARTGEQREISLEDVQRFSNAVNQIKSYYVDEVDDETLFDNAIRGMLQGLDPHSDYLDEDDFRDLQVATQGEFGGLGIEVTMENGVIKVVSPIDETPAQKAGIKPGDYIVRLNETPVKGMSLRDAVGSMRGEKGSSINLTIVREGEKEPISVTVVRDVIKVKSVKSRLLEGKYGYVKISQFQAPTAENVIEQVKALEKEAGGKLSGLILDLRNNPGGLLDSAIQISDAFIHNDSEGDEELIVYTKGRIQGSKYTVEATPGDILNNAPMVVLINEGSASGSEIVAGALHDNQRALLIGEKTFGKGSVQTVIPLDQLHGLKLTTALYYTPSGRSIQAEGIDPDITVENVTVQNQEEKFAATKEADLVGHLDNGNQDKNEKQAQANEGDANLIHTDYQLYEALNVLKGLALLRN